MGNDNEDGVEGVKAEDNTHAQPAEEHGAIGAME